jgi:hypothetical protein
MHRDRKKLLAARERERKKLSFVIFLCFEKNNLRVIKWGSYVNHVAIFLVI